MAKLLYDRLLLVNVCLRSLEFRLARINMPQFGSACCCVRISLGRFLIGYRRVIDLYLALNYFICVKGTVYLPGVCLSIFNLIKNISNMFDFSIVLDAVNGHVEVMITGNCIVIVLL